MRGGQWLKSIRFKLPIIEGDLSIGLYNDNHVETPYNGISETARHPA